MFSIWNTAQSCHSNKTGSKLGQAETRNAPHNLTTGQKKVRLRNSFNIPFSIRKHCLISRMAILAEVSKFEQSWLIFPGINILIKKFPLRFVFTDLRWRPFVLTITTEAWWNYFLLQNRGTPLLLQDVSTKTKWQFLLNSVSYKYKLIDHELYNRQWIISFTKLIYKTMKQKSVIVVLTRFLFSV